METGLKYNILSDSQYGFRKHRSTLCALTHLCDKISSSIDNKQFTVGIFIDLSKAFDTVDHNILLEKLEHYSIKVTALKWFFSYPNDRKQFVEFHDHCSTPCKIQCGVPQGSILGPCFFLFILMICVMYPMSWILFCLQMTQIYFLMKLNFSPKLLIMN